MSKLNILPSVVDRQVEHVSSHAGMAYFANTGPLGTFCGECGNREKRGRCLLAKQFNGGKSLVAVPAEASSCKYFTSDKMVIEPVAKPKPVALFENLPVQCKPA
jgi:hypothetical protein